MSFILDYVYVYCLITYIYSVDSPGAGVDDVYWIGATDAVHEGEFRWSNGLPFSYAREYISSQGYS